MKKKLVLLILLIGSIFGVFACKTVPYKNMKISTPEVYGYYEKSPSGDSEEFYEISNVNSFEKSQNQTLGWKALDDIVNLEITDEGNGDYSYDIKTVRVRVSDTNKKTDLGISLTGGDGFVSTNIKYLGDGITSITIKPISPQKTGKFTLCATTNEGNKTCYINVNIDLKLNYFEFKQDALKAIANGGEIDLQNVDDFINFYPTNTTQKDIKFDVVYPKDDSLDVDGNKFIYDIDLNNVKYGKYAEIIDNNILKTYKYYNNDKSQNMDYPIWDSTSNVGTNTTTGVKKIKISATFISKSGIQIYQTHLIEVVDECTDYKVMMNRQTPDLYASGEVALSSYKKDGINIYEVVLLDPNFRESMLGVDDPYYIRRQLRFDLNPQVDDAGNKSDYRVEDYQVVTNTVLETDNQPVVISNVALNSDYIIQAQSAGTYLHKFTIQNIKYPGLFDRDIYVQFIVKTVPTKITINDKEIVLNTLNDHVYTVYDYYPSWSYGTRFKVQINSEFKYFVYFDGEYDSDVFSNVKLYKNNGTLQKFGVLSSDGAGIVSADGSENYSRFSNESFYLRHELPMLPDREFNLYIGINFDMKADSYTDDVSDAFTTSLLSFPFKIKFENGIRNIAFTQKEYHVDLTNSKFVVRGDENTEEGIDFIRDGIKLFELPVGQTDETAIDSITYNEELVWVGSFTDAESNITTFYLKANNNFIVDKTTIRVTAYNGVSNSVTVHTYIPTVYANNIGKAPEAEMPLSVYVNKYSSGYLYHLATSVFNSEGGILDREELIEKNNSYSFDLTDNEGIDCGLYNSVGTLFMITNAQQEIRFYDYRLWYDYDYSGRKLAGHYEEIDITDKVKVSFNFGNYVSYKNGILKTYNFYSDFASSPIIMTIKYVGAYDLFDEDGNPIYTLYEVEHVIYLYVYKPLEGVEITSSKQVELYMRDTLSYYDLALSEGMIVSTFIPDQYDLGAEWNQILAIPSSTIYAITFEDGTIQNIAMYSVGDESEPYVEEDYWYINDKKTEYKANGSISIHGNAISVEKIGSNGTAGSKGVPVELLYDYNATLDNFIMKDDGTQLIIYPFNGNEDDAYQLRYRDLFEVEWNEINYTCNVVARLSKELVGDPANGLNGWLNDNYNGRVDDFLKTIFTSDITLTIYVSIRQFGKLQNINSVNFTASYANKIGGLRIDVDSDGVYFEVRNGYSTPESVALNYTIDTAEVANRNIRLYNAHTASYQADVRINSVGNGGSVTIIPTTTAGVEYLIIVPEDNIKNVDSLGNIEYYDRSLVKTVRIKVADGSEEYPFEIRNVSEYSQMLKDIDNEEMYHYIITRDIDLSLLNREFSAGNAIKNIPYGTGIGAFSLSGRLDYYNTDGILSSKYSSLYNLNIKVIAAINDGSIGLFGNIGSNVTIKYLGIANATIRIIIVCSYSCWM